MSERLRITFDTGASLAVISALAETGKRLPEFGEAVVNLLETGEQLFALDADSGATSCAGHLAVRLYPSDGFLGLVSAFRARNADLGGLEHALSSLECSKMVELSDAVESVTAVVPSTDPKVG